MHRDRTKTSRNYTCNEYREEMILLGLRRQLQQPGLTDDERKRLEEEVSRLERLIGM
jgi:hypothetical protein